MNKTELVIGGMTCAACSARVERAVQKLDGVISASVNLATEKLFVEFADTQTLSAIKETVIKTGYEVLEPQKVSDADENWARKQKEIRS